MTNITDEEDESGAFPLYLSVLFGIIIALLILFGILGNIFTIIAYIRDKQLHSVYNFYLLNLSITDLLLSVISMSFYAVYTLKGYVWPFGDAFCKVYMTADFTLCLESVLMIIIISFDRLFLLVYGPYYNSKITMKKGYIQIGVSWIIAFLLYGPAIIGWDIWTGENTVEEDDCDVQFAYDTTFTTVTAFIEFAVPFICIGTISGIIYHKIRTRNVVSQAPGRNNQHSSNRKSDSRPKRDIKAARFLSALVIVFFVTWAPYTITTIIIAFCGECVNIDLYEFFNWLLWSKAAINPFLYAYNSARFKKNFKEMIPMYSKIFKGTATQDGETETTHN